MTQARGQLLSTSVNRFDALVSQSRCECKLGRPGNLPGCSWRLPWKIPGWSLASLMQLGELSRLSDRTSQKNPIEVIRDLDALGQQVSCFTIFVQNSQKWHVLNTRHPARDLVRCEWLCMKQRVLKLLSTIPTNSYSFSYNHGVGTWLYFKGNYWRDPFVASMILGGRVASSAESEQAVAVWREKLHVLWLQVIIFQWSMWKHDEW